MKYCFYLQIAAFVALGLASSFGAAAHAVDDSKIRSLILGADVIPPSYREHINISRSGDMVLISVHRDPDAQPNDCRIDAIIMAEKVIEAGSPPKTVRVAFYDLSDNDKYWQVDVPTSAVASFANGTIGKEAVLGATSLSVNKTNQLAKSYAHLSYQDIIKELGVIAGSARDERALALVRLNTLQKNGGDTADLKRQFIHIEDLARRGDESALRAALTKLRSGLDKGNASHAAHEAALDNVRRLENQPSGPQ